MRNNFDQKSHIVSFNEKTDVTASRRAFITAYTLDTVLVTKKLVPQFRRLIWYIQAYDIPAIIVFRTNSDPVHPMCADFTRAMNLLQKWTKEGILKELSTKDILHHDL